MISECLSKVSSLSRPEQNEFDPLIKQLMLRDYALQRLDLEKTNPMPSLVED